LALAAFLMLVFLAASPGALFPPGEWYASLERPFYAPPSWLFGPVWTLLYIGIAVSGWLVWRKIGLRSEPMVWWVVQLLLNALWTPLFFGLHWLGVALIEMALLWLAILTCVRAFWRVDRTASILLMPYLAWVSFAWLLNAGFWWLNR
jgi:tryptophan-rich sensory protein